MLHLSRRRLGLTIRDRREAIGLTQENAAERANVSVRYWRSLKASRPAAAVEIVERVLHGLDWSWADLVETLAPEPDAQLTPRSVRRQLDVAWKSGTEREREVIRELLACWLAADAEGAVVRTRQ
jgi:transcriptional regulator with XRE-family HTH domain